MFVIYHDFLHHAIFYRSRLAKIIFYLFGLFTLAPFSIWKRTHDHHHKHNSKIVNGDIGPYPILTKEQYLAANKKTKLLYLASRHPINILLAYFTMFLYGMCLQPFINNPLRHYDCFIALVIHFLLGYYLISTGGVTTLILTMIIPFTMSFALGAYLFYVQHNFPDVQFLKKADWSITKAAIESSSFLEMGWFMRWSTGNIGYHHIHHLNCAIPFYQLPNVMKKVNELQKVKRTSLHWRNVLACLRLKLWDAEKNKMITLNEI
jgi:omega-6 fatty acid desaturase (delta-12 desaturase)